MYDTRWICVVVAVCFGLFGNAAVGAIGHPRTPLGGVSSRSSNERIAMTWYAGWHASDAPLESIAWSKYDVVAYSFAIPTEDPAKVELAMGDADSENLSRFVDLAHQHNVSALLSVGGWTGSRYFSTVIASNRSRETFAETMVNIINERGLDGLDFDWEFPGTQGIGCNVISSSDTPNFLSFMQTLRSKLTKPTLITAAVGSTPWAGLTNLSGFSSLIDYFAIMNYDMYSPQDPGVTHVGPNAPLQDSCIPKGTLNMGSASSSVQAWSDAGIPRNQILLAVPAYGHSYRVRKNDATASDNTLDITAAFDAKDPPKGDAWDDEAGVDMCGQQTQQGGLWSFWGLVDAKYLNNDGTHSSTVQYKWDNCSQTPFIYDPSKEIMVSYDDPESFRAKGSFIAQNGLGGFSMWEAGGDYKNLLLNAITDEMNSNVVNTATLSKPATIVPTDPAQNSAKSIQPLLGHILSLILLLSLQGL